MSVCVCVCGRVTPGETEPSNNGNDRRFIAKLFDLVVFALGLLGCSFVECRSCSYKHMSMPILTAQPSFSESRAPCCREFVSGSCRVLTL